MQLITNLVASSYYEIGGWYWKQKRIPPTVVTGQNFLLIKIYVIHQELDPLLSPVSISLPMIF